MIATRRAGWGTSTIMGLRTHAGPGSLRHGEKLQPATGLVPENTGPRRLWGTEVGALESAWLRSLPRDRLWGGHVLLRLSPSSLPGTLAT